MKSLLLVLVLVGVASCQDGSYILDSRGVEAQQGLLPSRQLYDNYEAFSDAFRQRSQQMATEYSLDQTIYNDPNPEYTWAYAVDAKSTGDMKSAREERRGDVVVGQYSVVDPDGTLRTVDYSVAPGTGFRAKVTKERADDVSGSPVKYHHQYQYSQYENQQPNRYQQQQYQQSQRNQNQESRSLNYQNIDNDFQNQRNNRNNYRSQLESQQYQDEKVERFNDRESNRNQFQNRQYYRQNFQNENENNLYSKENDGNYVFNQRYGYNRNHFDNNNHNSQISLYSRDGQYSQSYARLKGNTNKQNYNQNNNNYNNRQAQLQGIRNYNQYQQIRDSTTYKPDQYRMNFYNTQQEQKSEYNPNSQYRESQYNQNQYDNQYYQTQQRNNERQQHNGNTLRKNSNYNSPNYYQKTQNNQGNQSRRSQYHGDGQYRDNRFSQNHQSHLTKQTPGQNSQFYSRRSFENQNQNINRNYSPISVVLA